MQIAKLLNIFIPPDSSAIYLEINLVMEYYHTNLSQIIGNKNINIGCDQMSFIIYQLLCGIGYLHKCGIIHRVTFQ